MIKLKECIILLSKSKHKAQDADKEGIYNYYTSSSVIKKSNFCDYKEETIILGNGGNGSLFIDSNFSCSADNFLLQTNKEYNIKYLYYYLKIRFEELYKLYSGNGLKHLS